MENLNLGKCCCCEKENETVRNAITLDKKSPVKPGGWGCFVCGLEPEGAVAVVCDDCLEKVMTKESKIKFACLGYPGENRRIETGKLTEDFAHDMSKHPEEADQDFSEQDFIECQNCEKLISIVDGRCSNCNEKICIVCGCTDSTACPGGCFWTRPNICSQCDAATADQF